KPSQNDYCTLPKACCLHILGNCDRIRCHVLPPFVFSAYEQPRKLSLSARSKPFPFVFNQRAADWVFFGAGKFPRAHAENLVGCRPAILLASAIWSRESEPKYVCA